MSIIVKFRQYGFSNSFKRLVKKLLRMIGIRHEKYLYCTKDLDSERVEIIKPRINGEIIQLNETIINKPQLIDLSGEKLALFRKRLSNEGYKGYGFFHQDSLIYYTWISYKKFEMSVPSKVIELEDNEALLIDSYCHPDYRKYGIHLYMNNFRLEQIMNEGKNRVVAIVLKENKPARITQRKSGFKCEKMITYNKFFKFYENTKLVNKAIKL